MQCMELSDLTKLLYKDGDQVLDATSKLSLSASVLLKLNKTLKTIVPEYTEILPFHVLADDNPIDDFIDLHVLYDFIQKTIALKIFSEYGVFSNEVVDLRLFRNLKLLEVHRYSLNLIHGLRNLRPRLEYVTCRTSLTNLKDVLEQCGADKTQGHLWSVLKEAVFTHNNLNTVDESLEFAPSLNHLDLSFNLLRNVDNLNHLGNLRYLNLANNKLEMLPKFSGQLCANLQVLILRNNFIETINEAVDLHNLQELDLSNNCVIDIDHLSSLNCLSSLAKLRLVGNPISYHSNYRARVCHYLRWDASSVFELDGRRLSSKELRAVGGFNATLPLMDTASLPDESSPSPRSTASDAFYGQQVPSADVEFANSFQSSSTVVHVGNEAHGTNGQTKTEELLPPIVNRVLDVEMHDSGFEAGPQRPVSPIPSIETMIYQVIEETNSDPTNPNSQERSSSATSLHCPERRSTDAGHYEIQSDSDIEILSNPSQCSIEVLWSSLTPICVHSCLLNTIANSGVSSEASARKRVRRSSS